ncbi:bidirectional sugar transporter N3-like [Apium graveolens]|uniref:bidirectional sugar transporter N3-like n=1 Tax=Apium graveolens TaxID=4045 RepID=UPI003D7BA31C
MALFHLHNPWVFTAGILGNFVSILVYFAPLPTFIQIYKRKSTLEFQSLPYTVALFSAMLWIYYAFLKKNAILLISVNSVGIVIETVYILIFLFYASKQARKETMKVLVFLNVVLYGVIFGGTTLWFEGHHRVLIVGWICVTFSISVFAAPLYIVFQVVRTRSVEFMPLSLSFFLTLSATVWFAYGLLLKDPCVALPNVLGFILGVLQMLLYAIYRNSDTNKGETKLTDDKKHVAEVHINIIDIVKNVPGTVDQVYPLDSQTSSCSSSNVVSSDEDEHKDIADYSKPTQDIAPVSGENE